MLSDTTIQLYIEIAKITGFLAINTNQKQNAFSGGAINTRFPRLLYCVRKSVEWQRVNYPNTNALTQTALYMYNLCAPYAQKAYMILGQGGGIIVNPSTGARSTLLAINIEFIVGTLGSLLNAGDTVLTLNYSYIQNGSINIYMGGVILPPNQADQLSFTIAYTTANAVITFNQGAMDGQLYQITGQYFVNI